MTDGEVSETAVLLSNVDQTQARRLCMAFDDICAAEQANIGTVMWCIAQLQARILASVPMDSVAECSKQFGDMVTVAYPPMVVALERAKREHEGRPSFDG